MKLLRKQDADIFYKIFKNHNKDLNGIKSGSCIKFEDEFYILFYCEEMFVYNRLPSTYKEDWYFYNLQTRVIERVHSYNNFMLKYYSNQTK